jgi:Ca2+-binding RTX toxin-like protein
LQASSISSPTVISNFANKVFNLELKYSLGSESDLPLNLDFRGWGLNLPDGLISSSGALKAAAEADFDLSLAIDLKDAFHPVFILKDNSNAVVNLGISGANLKFQAGFGPLGLTVGDGTSSSKVNASARFGAALQPSSAGYILPSGFSFSNVILSLTGSASASLPVDFPVAGTALDPNQRNIELRVGKLDGGPPLKVDTLSNPAVNKIILPNFDAPLAAVGSFAQDLSDKWAALTSGWEGLFSALEDALDGEALGVKLPLIGDQLQSASGFIRKVRQEVTVLLQNSVPGARTAGLVQDIIFRALGPAGLNWLQDIDGDKDVDLADVKLAASSEQMRFDLKLGQTAAVADSPIAFDLSALPGLGLKADGRAHVQVGWAMSFGFGMNKSGFFVDFSKKDDLRVSFEATLPGLHAQGELLFLQLDVDDLGSSIKGAFDVDLDPQAAKGQLLSFADLRSGVRPFVAARLEGGANIDLALTASFEGSANFPRVRTELHIDWDLLSGDTRHGLDAVSIPRIYFDHTQLNAGDFINQLLGPIFSKIQSALAPIQPLLDILSARIPVISDLAGRTVTLIDIARLVGGSKAAKAADFIQAVIDINNLVKSLPNLSADAWIDVGKFGGLFGASAEGANLIDQADFRIDGSAALNPAMMGKLSAQYQQAKGYSEVQGEFGSQGEGFLKQAASAKGGFHIPILENPSSVFGLLLGKDIPLITYKMPELSVQFSYSQFFPVIGPLGARIGGRVGAKANFSFGFDTYGLREYMAAPAGSRDPSKIFDGFYISDRANADGTGADVPEVVLSGALTAAAELNIVVAQAGVGGGIFLDVYFNLNDPDRDGKVRVNELLNNFKLSPLLIFDVSGALTAGLFAYIKIGFPTPFGFVTIFEGNYDLASITLLKFDSSRPNNTPVLADQSGSVLKLRTTEGNDTIRVLPGPSANSVIVDSKGFQQTFNHVTSITADALGGNDSISIADGVTAQAQISGGSGNDKLETISARAAFLGGAGDDQLIGGNGDDFLDGGDGNDLIRGGRGNDLIHGGEGQDRLYGEAGDDTLLGDGAEDQVYGGAGNDVIDGGEGTDSLHGEAGNDALRGGAGDDDLKGGDDDDTLDGGAGADRLYGEAGQDVLHGGEGPDLLDGAVGFDALFGDEDDDLLLGGPSDDTLDGGGGTDIIYGNLGSDTIYGGAGNDTIYAGESVGGGDGGSHHVLDGGDGDDVIYGDIGNDTINAGNGNDVVFSLDGDDIIQAGPGEDLIHAGAGNDTVSGEGENDLIFGESGNDYLVGGEGNDTVYGGTDNDVLIGSAGADLLSGDDGQDILWGGVETFTRDQLATLASAPGLDAALGLYPTSDTQDKAALDGFLPAMITPAVVSGLSVQGQANDGADTLYGGKGTDWLFGGDDTDYLDGQADNDYADGGAGRDRVYGGDGNDVIRGGANDDVLHGGSGIDLLHGDAGQDYLFGDEGDSSGNQAGQRLFGGDDADYLFAYAPASDSAQYLKVGDQLFGEGGGDWLYGNVRREVLVGGAGNDNIFGDWLAGALYAVASRPDLNGGNDLLLGNGGQDQLLGGGGNDILWGGVDSDWLDGQNGDDSSFGGDWIDTIVADTNPDSTSRNDRVEGDLANEPVLGNPLVASQQNLNNSTDILLVQGTPSDDLIQLRRSIPGEPLKDRTGAPTGRTALGGQLLIQLNQSTFEVQWMNGSGVPAIEQFSISGLAGKDRIEFVSGQNALDVHALTARSNDWVAVINGGPGDDILRGTTGRDRMDGGAGKDAIFGLGGDDRLWGDAGEGDGSSSDYDKLFGGSGNDDLLGGQGKNDLYAWSENPWADLDADGIVEFGIFVKQDGTLTDDSDGGANKLEDTGLNRVLGGPGNDNLYGGTGLDFLYGAGGTNHLFTPEGEPFEDAFAALKGNEWKSYALATDKVWFYSATSADDVISVDYVTEPGLLQTHHLITRLTNNNGNFTFSAQVRLDFQATDDQGQFIWKPEDLAKGFQHLINASNEEARAGALDAVNYSEDDLISNLLPPEGDFLAIIIDALGGNDHVTVGPTVQKTVWIDAGAGNDTVKILSGNALLADKTEAGSRNGLDSDPSNSQRAFDLFAGTILASNATVTGLTMDNPGDVDWYKFQVAQATNPAAFLDLRSTSPLDGLGLGIYTRLGGELLLLNHGLDLPDLNGGNDSIENAYELGELHAFSEATGLTLHNALDADFFRISLAAAAATTDVLNLAQLEAEAGKPIAIALLDFSGNIIRQNTASGAGDVPLAQLSLAGLASGNYILRVSSGGMGRYEIVPRVSGQAGDSISLAGGQQARLSLAQLTPGRDYYLKVTTPNRLPTQYSLRFQLGIDPGFELEEGVNGAAPEDRRDIILGGLGNDVLAGGPGEDWILGGEGNDVLAGGLDRQAPDLLFGEGGDDTFQIIPDDLPLLKNSTETFVPTFADTFDGGPDNDRVLFLGGDLQGNNPIPDDIALRWNRFLRRYEFTSLVWDLANSRYMTGAATPAVYISEKELSSFKLASNISLGISLNHGASYAPVVVPVAETSDNITIEDLAVDINRAIVASGLQNSVVAGYDGLHLTLSTLDTGSNASLLLRMNADFANRLGAETSISSDGPPIVDLGVDALFTVLLDGGQAIAVVLPHAGPHGTGDNSDINDLVADIQAALAGVGLSQRLAAKADGDRLQFTRMDEGGNGSTIELSIPEEIPILDWNFDDKIPSVEYHYSWSATEVKPGILAGNNANGGSPNSLGKDGSSGWFLNLNTTSFQAESAPLYAGGGSGSSGPAYLAEFNSPDLTQYRVTFDGRVLGLAPGVSATSAVLQLLLNTPDNTLEPSDPNSDPDLLLQLNFTLDQVSNNWKTYSFLLSAGIVGNGSKEAFARLLGKINSLNAQIQIENATAPDWGFDDNNTFAVDNFKIERLYPGDKLRFANTRTGGQELKGAANPRLQHYLFFTAPRVERLAIQTRSGDDEIHLDSSYVFPETQAEWGFSAGDLEQGAALVYAELDGGAGNDHIYGGAYAEKITGGDGNDFIAGGLGNDMIDGGAGDDVIAGENAVPQDRFEYVGSMGDAGRNDNVTFAQRLPAPAANQIILDLTINEGDGGDWYLIPAPLALHPYGADTKAVLTRDLLDIHFAPGADAGNNPETLFQQAAAAGKGFFLFPAERKVVNGVDSYLPVETSDGTPEYYLLHVANVAAYDRITALTSADYRLNAGATIAFKIDDIVTPSLSIQPDPSISSAEDLVSALENALDNVSMNAGTARLGDFIQAGFDAASSRYYFQLRHPGELQIQAIAGAALGFSSGQRSAQILPAMGAYSIGFKAGLGETTFLGPEDAELAISSSYLGDQPAVIPLGDINGDGYADFIEAVNDVVGGPDELKSFLGLTINGGRPNLPDILASSFARIYFGGQSASGNIALDSNNSISLKLPAPVMQPSVFGSQTKFANAGDFNGDGLMDIAISVGLVNNNFQSLYFEAAGVYIVYGGNFAPGSVVDMIGSADVTLKGFSYVSGIAAADYGSNTEVDNLPDGISDLYVKDQNGAYVFYGSTSWPMTGYAINETFDNGQGAWTVVNDTATTGAQVDGLWHISTGHENQFGHSKGNSFYFGQFEDPFSGGGSYSDGYTAGWIISPEIDLSGTSSAELRFNYLLQTTNSREIARVDISADGGANWQQLPGASNKDGGLWDQKNVGSDYVQWFGAKIDLTGYIGQNVRLRFVFDTVDDFYFGSAEGWYVDDVRIESVVTPGMADRQNVPDFQFIPFGNIDGGGWDYGRTVLLSNTAIGETGSFISEQVGAIYLNHNLDAHPDLLVKSARPRLNQPSISPQLFGMIENLVDSPADLATGSTLTEFAIADQLGGMLHVFLGRSRGGIPIGPEGESENIHPSEKFIFDLAAPAEGAPSAQPPPSLIDPSGRPDLANAPVLLGHSPDEEISQAQSIGDINGDHIPDLMVVGKAWTYIFLGPFDISRPEDVLDQADYLIRESEFGAPAQRLGDINGDGISDLLFIKDEGIGYHTLTVLLSRPDLGEVAFHREITRASLDGRRVMSASIFGLSGEASAFALNWNGPGADGKVHEDILVSSLSGDSSYVFGDNATDSASFSIIMNFTRDQTSAFDRNNVLNGVFGASTVNSGIVRDAYDGSSIRATVAGDVNGDGLDDIVFVDQAWMPISYKDATLAIPNIGRAYLFLGRREADALGLNQSDQIWQDFGLSRAFALADLDKDGYDDFAFASYMELGSNGTTPVGYLPVMKSSMFLHFGGPLQVSGDPIYIFDLGQDMGKTRIHSGTALALPNSQGIFSEFSASAGDFNHDGKMDLAIGQSRALRSHSVWPSLRLPGLQGTDVIDQNEQGRVFIFWSVAERGAELALSEDGVDANGDGTLDEGIDWNHDARIDSADVVIKGKLASDQLGTLVNGPAIDLNADGIDDLIVGAAGSSVFSNPVRTRAGQVYFLQGRLENRSFHPIAPITLTNGGTLSGNYLVSSPTGQPATVSGSLNPGSEIWYQFATLGAGQSGNYIEISPGPEPGAMQPVSLQTGSVSNSELNTGGGEAFDVGGNSTGLIDIDLSGYLRYRDNLDLIQSASLQLDYFVQSSAPKNPLSFTLVGDHLYFVAEGGAGIGRQLYRLDTDGTLTLYRTNPTGSSYPDSLAALNQTLFFKGDDADRNHKLWRIDSNGNLQSVQISANFLSSMVLAGDRLFFSATSQFHSNSDLYSVNENGGISEYYVNDINSAYPANFTVAGSNFYFTASKGSVFDKLFRVDAAGVLKDFGISGVSHPFNVDGTVYFWRNNPSGLWKVSGDTAAGLGLNRSLTNIDAGGAAAAQGSLYVVGGSFSQTLIYKINLSNGQTTVVDLGMSINPVLLPIPNGPMLIGGYGPGQFKGIWRVDSATGSAVLLDSDVAVEANPARAKVGDAFYFAASRNAEIGIARINSDGTLVFFAVPGGTLGANNLMAVDNKLLFFATGTYGRELYEIDESGLFLVKDIRVSGDSIDYSAESIFYHYCPDVHDAEVGLALCFQWWERGPRV